AEDDWRGAAPVPRLVHGDVRGDELETRLGPWSILVHGDVIADKIELWAGRDRSSTLVVTGTVRAGCLRYRGPANVAVVGDVMIDHVIVGNAGATLHARAIE